VSRWLNITALKKRMQELFSVHYNVCMEQPKNPRGRPRKAEGEKLERLVLFVPRSTRLKVEEHGQEWLRAAIRRARPPAG
jgi:GTPase involved in cell partitioning and DNA repair